MDRLIVTPEEAAKMLVTSPDEIRSWIHEGLLPAYQTGRNYKIVITQLQKFIEAKAEYETERRRKCRK